jgi:methionyl-tRNA synthetase
LRFFYAGNLGSGPEDFDLSLNEFRLRVNADLVNTIGNLANRALSLLAGPLEKRLAPAEPGAGRAMVEKSLEAVSIVRSAMERLEYRAALKKIVEIAQAANQFLQIQAPWNALKTSPETARRDLSDAAEVVYLLAALLEPVVPSLSHKLFTQLNAPPLTYRQLASASYPLLDRGRPVGTPAPLIGRLEESQVKAILAPSGAPPSPPTTQGYSGAGGIPAEIEYPDFSKVVLKVGKVLAAERLPKADELLKLTVDVGEGAPRTIAAGIAKAYAPEQLVGRNVVVVANLKARKLRGIQSQGMILAAGPGGTQLSLVDPGPMPPGTEVK